MDTSPLIRTLNDIAERAGTPCYVYDRTRIEANYGRIARAFGPDGGPQPDICYAVKANSNLEILRVLRALGAAFDVVSAGEMFAALRAGADPERIVFAGVGKRDDELIAALDARVGWVNVESAQELRVLSDLAVARGRVARVALRINPSVDPHTHAHLATGAHGSKFGIDAGEAVQLAAQHGAYPGARIEGLHVHIGSMVSEPGPYYEALDVMLDLVARCRAAGAPIANLDMGGGFGIAYHAGQTAAPVEAIGREIAARSRAAGLHLHIEPGRAVIADAGVLITRVLYTKTNGETDYVIVDAAMNDLIRPALYGAVHRVTALNPRPGAPLRRVSVAGPVCESGDFLARDVELPAVERGDVLVIHDTGAYGMSMASNYNLRPRAAEVLIEGSAWRLIRARERLEDVLEMRAA